MDRTQSVVDNKMTVNSLIQTTCQPLDIQPTSAGQYTIGGPNLLAGLEEPGQKLHRFIISRTYQLVPCAVHYEPRFAD